MIDSNEFMANFPGFCLQTFDDRKEKDKSLIRYGIPEQLSWQDLKMLNQKGAGVFFSPNAFPEGIRKKDHCKGVNAWFFEIDDASFEEQRDRINSAPLHPDIIVQTRKSLHCYYLAEDATVEQFVTIQKGLIKYFNADKACKDITRVLRVPGFTHNKEEPIEVKIVHYDPKTHTEADILKLFPYEEVVEKSVKTKVGKTVIDGDDFWSAAAKLDNKLMLEKLSGTTMVNGETFSFRARSGGGEYIDVNGQEADAWIDVSGSIGSGKKGGPTYIQWLEFYGRSKGKIAEWIKESCAGLLPRQLKEEKKKSKNQSEMLYELFLDQAPVVFRDQMGEGYVSVQVDSRNRIMKSESSKFSKYLRRLYYQETVTAIGGEAVKKNKLKSGYIRPLVYYGHGPLRVVPVEEIPVDVIIACWPWGAYLPAEAVDLQVSQYIRIHPESSVADAKISGHYVNSLLASLAIKGTHYHDAMLLDADGFVAESTASNVFIVKDGKLITTPPGTILKGITRDTLIELARDQGLEVVEEKFTALDVQEADEALLCGTAVEVAAIRSLDDKLIGDGSMGPITKQLKSLYLQVVKGGVDKYQRFLTIVK